MLCGEGHRLVVLPYGTVSNGRSGAGEQASDYISNQEQRKDGRGLACSFCNNLENYQEIA